MKVVSIVLSMMAASALKLPDPMCKTGVISLASEAGADRACCAGYCGECGDYATCGSVRGQDSENACCASKVIGLECGEGAAANVCLKTCDKAVPPCIMGEFEFVTPKKGARSAGTDCNEAVTDWRAKAENAITAGEEAAAEKK